MARMVPPAMAAGSKKDPERRVFRLIEEETPAGWVGLHHVGVPRHPYKPIGEIDFIVISDLGVFSLEVKGGPVGCRDGVWYAGKRDLRESPFMQVGGASAALRNETREIQPYLSGYGCVFPDCVFSVESEEVLPEVVYDESDHAAGFRAYIERLAEFWRSRYPKAKPLDANAVARVQKALRPDFDLVESVMPSVREAKRSLVAYTDQQRRAISGLREQDRVVVRGGAGTGKTLIAINEACRLAESGAQTLLTCYSKALAAHLEKRLDQTNLTVEHSDKLITRLIKEGGTEGMVPDDASDEDRFEVHRPLAAMEAASLLQLAESYDALVIDEGQDLLTEGRLDVLGCLLRGGMRAGSWRVFWDQQQAILLGADANLKHLHDYESYPLDINCRNTREIAEQVRYLSGIGTDEVAFTEGPKTVDREWSDRKGQSKAARACIKDWLDQGVPPEAITILSPRRFASSAAASDLGIGVRIRDRSGEPPEDEPGVIPFSTIQSFKGLESDAVLLADVDDLDTNTARGLLYVGASRARTLLAVLRAQETTPTFIDRVAEAEKQGRRELEPFELM